jgi:hypothetical protein
MGSKFHKHHIVPKYLGGTNDPENLILVTKDHHALIHWWYYRMWGNKEDLGACLLLLNMSEELNKIHRSMGAEATRRLWAKGGEWVQNRKEQLKRATAKSHVSRKKRRAENPEYATEVKKRMSHLGKIGGVKGGKAGGASVGKQRWQCTVTGRILPPGLLSIYQRSRGIATTNRERLISG